MINNETQLNSWEKSYEDLLRSQQERNVHPLQEDNPEVINNVISTFMEIFQQAPEERRKILATAPLFPKEMKFKNRFESITTTRPLYYIMATANKKALKIISPYLEDKDWLERGAYNSTFMHMIVGGLEHNFSYSGKPYECAQKLLEKFPKLKSETNMYHTTPLQYLELVIDKLRNNIAYASHAKSPLVKDIKEESYTETPDQYNFLIGQAQKIEFLLKY